MAPWKLPLIVAGIIVPIVVAFYVGGGGVGLGFGALAAFSLVIIAVRERPRGPISSAPVKDAKRHVLIVAATAVEDPGDVGRVVDAAEFGSAGDVPDLLVLVPARIGFLDRWASDVESARHRAQQHLVATVAALAKAGIAAEARVGDEDIVQAVEDQLQSYPATEVVLVSGAEDGAEGAAAELQSRLQARFREVRLGGRDAQQA